MTIQTLVNITGVTDSTPLTQTYVVAMDLDAASKTVSNLKGSVYSRVRRAARDVYETALAAVGGDVTKMDCAKMRLEFKEQLEAAESAYAGKEPDVKAKNTWNQYKRNLARALFVGVDFIMNAEIAVGELNTLLKDIDDAEEAASDAAAKKERGDKPEDTGANGADADGKPAADVKNIGEGIVFATEADEVLFKEMIELMVGISQKDPKELSGMLKGTVQQLSAKSVKVIAAFAKPQAA